MGVDDEPRIPAWVLGEGEEPDNVSTQLYLDEVESIESVRDVLRLWHDTAAGALLEAAVPAGWAAPASRLSATRWDQGLTEQLSSLHRTWSFDSDEPYVPYTVTTWASRSAVDGPRHLLLRAGVSFPASQEGGVLAAAVELVRVVAD